MRQLSLGNLILTIENIVKNCGIDQNEASVSFDFGDTFPTILESYRGDYEELAFNFHQDRCCAPPTAFEFIKLLKDALGKTFEGYKGGEYVMNERTPLWVANYGSGSSTKIVGASHNYIDDIILITEYDFDM